MEHGLYIGSITHYVGFTPPYGVTNVTGQCGRDNVTNMSSPSSATPQGSQSNSLGFAAKVLYAWTMLAARPMKCEGVSNTITQLRFPGFCFSETSLLGKQGQICFAEYLKISTFFSLKLFVTTVQPSLVAVN